MPHEGLKGSFGASRFWLGLHILDQPQLIIVTTPQDLAVLDAKKSINMAKRMKIPILGIVENMSGKVFGRKGKKLAESFGCELLAQIELRADFAHIDISGSPASQKITTLHKKFTALAKKIEKTSKESSGL